MNFRFQRKRGCTCIESRRYLLSVLLESRIVFTFCLFLTLNASKDLEPNAVDRQQGPGGLCIPTSRGCVVMDPLEFPFGRILHMFGDLLPDQTSTLELLAEGRHAVVIGPGAPFLVLSLAQKKILSLTVIHHFSKRCKEIRRTFQMNNIIWPAFHNYVSTDDHRFMNISACKLSYSLLDFYSKRDQGRGDMATERIGSIGFSGIAREPMILILQDAPNVTHAVEVALLHCRVLQDTVLAVHLPYDGEGAIFAVEQLRTLHLISRAYPESGPHAGRGSCFWHLSDLSSAGATRGGAAAAHAEWLEHIPPWLDVVCLPPHLAHLPPSTTRCPCSAAAAAAAASNKGCGGGQGGLGGGRAPPAAEDARSLRPPVSPRRLHQWLLLLRRRRRRRVAVGKVEAAGRGERRLVSGGR
jgi:hypothetical protein